VTKENQLLENIEKNKNMDEDYQHEYTSDSRGRPLEGGKYYRLHLLPYIFKNCFWSVIVYDSLTKLIIQNDQLWPSVHSKCRKLDVNPDGSVDIRFGPAAAKEKAVNWLQTIPGKEWYIVLRIYNAPEACLARGWNPGDIEEILT
jgi:hypothetical protein